MVKPDDIRLDDMGLSFAAAIAHSIESKHGLKLETN